MQIGNLNLGKYPVFLAPLEDITDSAFRKICRKFGASVTYTEFSSSEALIRDVEKTFKKIHFSESERPIGIQLFGNNPDSMRESAEIVAKLKPDIIDLNFGCPVKKIARKGSGAALLQNLPLMFKITSEVVKSVDIPVTVKTRLGWDESSKNIVTIAEQLQDIGVQAITIHGRTRSQMYKGEADWTLIGEVKNNPRMKIPIIGNGDITSGEVAKEMFDKYGVDAIMVGRACIGNPWIFQQINLYLKNGENIAIPSLSDKIDVCKNHLKLSAEMKGETVAVIELRKHYSGYFKAIPFFKEIKKELMEAKTIFEVEKALNKALEENRF